MPAKKEKEESLNLLTRGIISAVFLIVAFNLAYGSFFRDNPLYGIRFLAEVLISLVAALVGFFVVPVAYLQMKHWVETIISDTIVRIVGDFWEQQTSRAEKKKLEKEKERAEEERKKLKEELDNSVLLDTSVLVDGRVMEIVKTGFFDKTLVVPSAVMNELHLISDSKDKLKRERGRRGLDIVKKLKSKTKVIFPSMRSKENGVDKKLLEFAKKHKLRLMTQDFNLNKLAQAQGVRVLNINELVEAVKVNVLPGEVLEIEVQHEGKEKKQGVGYMPDGTMVVIKDSDKYMGKKVEAKVNKVIQSKAGKMIFCDLADNKKKK